MGIATDIHKFHNTYYLVVARAYPTVPELSFSVSIPLDAAAPALAEALRDGCRVVEKLREVLLEYAAQKEGALSDDYVHKIYAIADELRAADCTDIEHSILADILSYHDSVDFLRRYPELIVAAWEAAERDASFLCNWLPSILGMDLECRKRDRR